MDFYKKYREWINAGTIIILGILIGFHESTETNLLKYFKTNILSQFYTLITGFLAFMVTKYFERIKEIEEEISQKIEEYKSKVDEYQQDVSSKFDQIIGEIKEQKGDITTKIDEYQQNVGKKIDFIENYYSKILSEQMQMNEGHFVGCENRLGKIIEYFALGTGENGKLERVISKIKEEGKIRWLVSKFISSKIQQEFKEGDGETELVISKIRSKFFVDFVEDIINDCEDSILWTCPYLPEEWFNRALPEGNSFNINLTIDNFPFLKKFSASKLNKKYRIVNLKPEDLNLLKGDKTIDNPKAFIEKLEKFIEINTSNGLQLYFVDLKKLLTNDLPDNSLLYGDFGIYDRKVTLGYDDNAENLRLNLDVIVYKDLLDAILSIRPDQVLSEGIYLPENVVTDLRNKY